MQRAERIHQEGGRRREEELELQQQKLHGICTTHKDWVKRENIIIFSSHHLIAFRPVSHPVPYIRTHLWQKEASRWTYE